MRRISIIICFFYLLAANINGQIKPSDFSPSEEKAAKNLAVSFFNRFQETQDIAPLIKEYFVADFARRLKFCDTTGECGGFAKDFWGKKEEFIAVNVTEIDSQRFYVSELNCSFLYVRLFQYLNNMNKNFTQDMSDKDREALAKSVERELKPLLKDNLKLIKFNIFADSNEWETSKFRSLDDIHRFLNNSEKFVSALKIVETKLRINLLKEKPDAEISFSPRDFRVDVEKNHDRFFDYPVGTRMLEVWGENDSVPFVMDLIEEDGKLKIVAVYPPID